MEKELKEVWLASWSVEFEGERFSDLFPSFDSAYRELGAFVDEGMYRENALINMFERTDTDQGVRFDYTDHTVYFIRYTVEQLLAKG